MLRTNSGDSAWGGAGPDVRRSPFTAAHSQRPICMPRHTPTCTPNVHAYTRMPIRACLYVQVQRLVDFTDALEAAADDYQLATVVREYTAAKRWAAYLAIDRAVEAWDGPTNFRTMSGNPSLSWTHNFFVCATHACAYVCVRVHAHAYAAPDSNAHARVCTRTRVQVRGG